MVTFRFTLVGSRWDGLMNPALHVIEDSFDAETALEGAARGFCTALLPALVF